MSYSCRVEKCMYNTKSEMIMRISTHVFGLYSFSNVSVLYCTGSVQYSATSIPKNYHLD